MQSNNIRVVIHTGRFNYRSLKVTNQSELKLIAMFTATEINGQLHIEVSEEAYKAIFHL